MITYDKSLQRKLNRIIPSCRLGKDESVFDAVKRAFGPDATVDTFWNAYALEPNPKYTADYGEPIGQVTVLPREWYYIYDRRRKNNTLPTVV